MYTSTEIQAAVDKLVQGSIRTPIGPLGNRELTTTLNDIQDTVAGVLITFQNAPYYLVYLGAQRLRSSVRASLIAVEDLLDAIAATGRHTMPVETLSSLFNASVALGDLASSTAGRSSSFSNIEEVPAYLRFEKNTAQFLREVGDNVKQGGDIVKTPDEGRILIPFFISTLKELHLSLLESMTYLKNSIEDFTNLNLSSSLSAGIIANAKKVIADMAEEMDGLSTDGRMERLREVVLDILAARAVVKGFGALPPPSTFIRIDGIGAAYADTSHPATPAKVSADIYGPYPLLGDSNQLDVLLESASSITLTLHMPGSYVAFIPGALPELYNVDLAERDIDIGFTDQPNAQVVLSSALNTTAFTQVLLLNAAFVATWAPVPYVEAEVSYYPVKWVGELAIIDDGIAPGTDAFLADLSVDFAALGVDPAIDYVVVRSGINKGKEYDITAIAVNQLSCQVAHGSATISDPAARVEVGSPPARIRLFIPEVHHADALQYNWAITLPLLYSAGGGGDATVALSSIGFFPQSVATSRPITALEIEEEVNKTPHVAVAQDTRIVVGTQFSATLYSGKGRTEPTTSLTYVLYKLRGYASLATVGPVTTITLAGAAEAGAVVGDIIVLREATNPSEVNSFTTIASIASDDSYVTAVFSTPPANITDVLVEVGSSTYPPNNCILRVAEGSVADGEYRVARSGAVDSTVIPFELSLLGAIPVTAVGGLPILAENAELGLRRVTFSTTDKTLASRVQITDGDPFYSDGVTPVANPSTAFSLVFAGSVDEWGTTPYFAIPEANKSIELGDSLEVYINNPFIPDTAHPITGLEISSKRIKVSLELPCNLTPTLMALDQQVPFSRIRRTQSQTFDTFSSATEVWLTLPANKSIYYQNLYAEVNPLLRSSNPTAVQVGDATSYVTQLYTTLAEADLILAEYEASVVSSVDTLVGSLLGRGADRAVDILLLGRFSDFFGMTVSSVSYSGHMMEQIRAVQREDLPIRKVRRRDLEGQTLLVSYEEQDFEFDLSDIEEVGLPDVPYSPPPT